MPGAPAYTDADLDTFRRLASGEAKDVDDLAVRFGSAIGRTVSRAAADSLLRRAGLSAHDVVRANGAMNGGKPVVIAPPPPPVAPPPPQEVRVVYEPPPPPVIPVGRELTVALGGDLHDPERDGPSWSAFLRFCADRKPDVIVLTEMLEWLSVSAHNGGSWGARWDDDRRHGQRLFVQIRSINPDAEIVVLESNHDTRLERILAQRLPSMIGAHAIPSELHLDDLGIRWIPEEQSYRVGRLKVIHGHQLASNPEKGMLPENACKRAIQRFGEPGWTVVFFHTHRKGYWAERHDSGSFEAVNLPCLRTLHPDWHRGWVAGHSNGFGVAHVGPAGQTNLYQVDIEHGSFVYGGQRYAA